MHVDMRKARCCAIILLCCLHSALVRRCRRLDTAAELQALLSCSCVKKLQEAAGDRLRGLVVLSCVPYSTRAGILLSAGKEAAKGCYVACSMHSCHIIGMLLQRCVYLARGMPPSGVLYVVFVYRTASGSLLACLLAC